MSYYCSICKDSITRGEYKYSMEKFDKALCRKHQRFSVNTPITETSSKATNEANRLYVALSELGWKVQSEPYDGFKHVDLAIPEAKIDIEVDGQHHNTSSKQALADVKRTFHSFRKGIFTLRIPNSLVNDQVRLSDTAKHLDQLLQERVKQLNKDQQRDRFAKIGKLVLYGTLTYLILEYFGVFA